MSRRLEHPDEGHLEDRADHAPGSARAPRPRPHKVTLYVRPEQIMELEEIQLRERRRTGKRPDKSELVQEALDLLIEKYRNAG